MCNSTYAEAGTTDYLVQVHQPNGNLKYLRAPGGRFTPFADQAWLFRNHGDAQKLAVLRGGVVVNGEDALGE